MHRVWSPWREVTNGVHLRVRRGDSPYMQQQRNVFRDAWRTKVTSGIAGEWECLETSRTRNWLSFHILNVTGDLLYDRAETYEVVTRRLARKEQLRRQRAGAR